MRLKISSRRFGEQFVHFDDSDWPLLEKYTWYINKYDSKLYATTTLYDSNTKKSTPLLMHRLLMGSPQKRMVDHIDCNSLNNHRSNLRLVDWFGSNANARISKNNTSGFKGVSFHKKRGMYFAQIDANNRHYFGGYFNSAIEAALRYDELSKKLHKSFSHPNFKEANFPLSNDAVVVQNIPSSITGYRGVFLNKRAKSNGHKFYAKIVVNKKQIYLIQTSSVKKAAEAYNRAAKKYFGQKAILNPI